MDRRFVYRTSIENAVSLNAMLLMRMDAGQESIYKKRQFKNHLDSQPRTPFCQLSTENVVAEEAHA